MAVWVGTAKRPSDHIFPAVAAVTIGMAVWVGTAKRPSDHIFPAVAVAAVTITTTPRMIGAGHRMMLFGTLNLTDLVSANLVLKRRKRGLQHIRTKQRRAL
jgi:hypothetical protein